MQRLQGKASGFFSCMESGERGVCALHMHNENYSCLVPLQILDEVLHLE